MKRKLSLLCLLALILFLFVQCTTKNVSVNKNSKILFLHHSTGSVIFKGDKDAETGIGKDLPSWLKEYNEKNATLYSITEQAFPKSKPYGWKNYPHDYYNIWVKNAGEQPFMEESTLEILTKQYDVIIFKHCYPVGNIVEDTNNPDIDSKVKSFENYKLQYQALKQKMQSFPDTKFIVWTGAVQVEPNTTVEKAQRAKAFFDWVKSEWDEKNDNVFIFDFYALETEGTLYLKPEYAREPDNSHPNKDFAKYVIPLYGQRIVDVIENEGNGTSLTGEL